MKIFFVIGSKQLAALQSLSGDMWNQTVISYLIPLVWVMCQGSIAELTVLLKLKQRGIFREKENRIYGNNQYFAALRLVYYHRRSGEYENMKM